MLVTAALQLLCPVLRRVLGDRGIQFHRGPADGRDRGEPRPHRQFHLCSLAASVGPDCRGHSAGQLQLQVPQHPAHLPGIDDRSLRPPRQPARNPLLVLNSWGELQHQQGIHDPAGGAGAGLIGGCWGRGGRDGRHQAAPPMPWAVVTGAQGNRVFRCSFCSRGAEPLRRKGSAGNSAECSSCSFCSMEQFGNRLGTTQNHCGAGVEQK